MALEPQQETLGFEAEVQQLLKLVAHNLYSNKEIFVRELVSNASDAADKLRYETLANDALYEGDSDLKIWITYDEKANTVTIRDNGIGMNRDDVIANLGTIAKSGTQAFKDMLESKSGGDNSQMIGQFGVGFYSSFVVADDVVVRTRRAGMKSDEGVEWTSKGEGEFTVKNIERKERGTEVILHLKEECKEFADGMRLRTIIRKYSDHILLPIMMLEVEAPAADAADEDKDKKKEDKKQPTWESVNQANALWTMPKSEITDEQYQDLYKHISHDFRDALSWIHNKVEGTLEYTSLLYVPEFAPFDLWNRENLQGIKLYVKRVFIMDDAEHFMPMYLRFIKGVIDTNDLPLNISRELLQSNRVIDKIRSGCVKKVLSELEKMAKNDAEKYQKFWDAFGQVIKEGPAEDFANKDKVAKLLRFASTHEGGTTQNVSLADYVSRMKEGQEKIYYIVGDTHAAASNSPLLEVFRKRGVEVLLMSDRVDEWLVGHLTEFEGKQWQSIAKGEVDLPEEDKDEAVKAKEKEQEDEFAGFVKQMQEVLKDQVQEVRLTQRLTDSPACVVFGNDEMSGHMQRLMEAAGQSMDRPKPIFEVNPSHPLIQRVRSEQDDDRFANWSDVLLSQALLAEGEQLPDPAHYVKRLNELLLQL
ncbi:MAG: molecular chaperone HtpG [Coxiellaceae bacterium]|nr:molecular chaperone HtpG [Coxiellaceae bacterium]